MEQEKFPANSDPSRSILGALERKIAGLPDDSRAPLQQELEHVRAILEDQNRCTAELQDIARRFRESESRFQILADSNPLLVWITDTAGGNLFINKAYREFIGVTLEHVQGLRWAELLHPDDALAYFQAFQQAVRAQRPFRAEARVRRADGAWRLLLSNAEPHFSDDGIFTGHIGNSVDITDQKQAEMVIRESREAAVSEANRLRAVLEALPVGVSLLDVKGGVLQTNHGFHEVWGGPLPETASVDDYGQYLAWWVETGLPVQPGEWASARAVRNNETVAGQFLEIRRFDGRRAYVMNSAAPFHDASGQVVGAAVVIMDITDKVKIEQALSESENRLRIALGNSPINVFTQDRDLRYTWVFRPVTGWSEDDYFGKRDDQLPFLEEVGEIITAKQQVIETGKPLLAEINTRVNGKDIIYLMNLEPFWNEQGQVAGLRGSTIDITEQRQLQAQQLEYRTQVEVHHRLMEQREKDRQAIARDIHDGPVQTLASTLFNLQFTKEAFTNPQIRAEIEQISLDVRTAIQELRQVIFELRPPSVIRFGLARAIRFHAEDIQDKDPGLKLNLSLSEDGSQLSEMMVLTLFRIYQEALTNVTRHAKASEVWVRFALKKNFLTLEIRDNGIGIIPDKNLGVLIENGHYGLAGIKERCEAINGELIINSTPGKGTRLKVKVPLDKII